MLTLLINDKAEFSIERDGIVTPLYKKLALDLAPKPEVPDMSYGGGSPVLFNLYCELDRMVLLFVGIHMEVDALIAHATNPEATPEHRKKDYDDMHDYYKNQRHPWVGAPDKDVINFCIIDFDAPTV